MGVSVPSPFARPFRKVRIWIKVCQVRWFWATTALWRLLQRCWVLLASVYLHCPYLSLTPCALSLGSSGLRTMFILCCCLLLTLRRQGRCTHLSHLAHRRGHGRFLGWSALGAQDLALPHNQPHYDSSHVWLLPGHLRDLHDRPG